MEHATLILFVGFTKKEIPMFLICPTCNKIVESKSKRPPYLCPSCQSDLTVYSRSAVVNREAKGKDGNFELSLKEAFESIGLSQLAARQAAKGRNMTEVSDDVNDPMKFESFLAEAFEEMGLSEGAAKQAAKGHGIAGVSDDVVNDPAKQTAFLTEAFEAIGLSEGAAKQAAKGRGIAGAPDDVVNDPAKNEALLTEVFIGIGLSEGAAKIAAKGRR